MSLARPRKITVNGKQYHWKTSKNGKFHLVIQDPEDNGRKLVVQYSTVRQITPRQVRYRILKAPKDWNDEIIIDGD